LLPFANRQEPSVSAQPLKTGLSLSFTPKAGMRQRRPVARPFQLSSQAMAAARSAKIWWSLAGNSAAAALTSKAAPFSRSR